MSAASLDRHEHPGGAAFAPGRADTASETATETLAASRRHHAAYVSIANRILACREQAEDVVQDVMLRLAAAPPSDEIRSAAYIGRMVRNLAIDQARRRNLERRLFARLDEALDPVDPAAGTPEVAAASRQALQRVSAAIAQLPEPIGTAFRLHRVDGVPQNVIAARMGVSRALVCGLVRRGHLHCLAALDRRCGACPAGTRAGQPHQHQRQAETVGEELGRDPARQHAVIPEQPRQDQERRDQRQPLRRQRDRGGPARGADRLEQGRGGEL
jgi:RNA polymerase sigma factor (sigma-70 family)